MLLFFLVPVRKLLPPPIWFQDPITQFNFEWYAGTLTGLEQFRVVFGGLIFYFILLKHYLVNDIKTKLKLTILGNKEVEEVKMKNMLETKGTRVIFLITMIVCFFFGIIGLIIGMIIEASIDLKYIIFPLSLLLLLGWLIYLDYFYYKSIYQILNHLQSELYQKQSQGLSEQIKQRPNG